MTSTTTSQDYLGQAWQDFIKHIPTVAAIFAASIGIAIVDYIVFFVVYLLFGGLESETEGIASLLGYAASLPITIINWLVGILYVAVPAVYYSRDKKVLPGEAFSLLFGKFWRYIWAGVVYTAAFSLGLLFCIIPGIIVAFATPIYVNRVFNSSQPPIEALSSSISALFKSEKGWEFIGIQILTGLLVMVIGICTCGLGFFVAGPTGIFYIQKIGYVKGVIK